MIVHTTKGSGKYIRAEEQPQGARVVFSTAAEGADKVEDSIFVGGVGADAVFRAAVDALRGNIPLSLKNDADIAFVRDLYSSPLPKKTSRQPPGKGGASGWPNLPP